MSPLQEYFISTGDYPSTPARGAMWFGHVRL